MSVFIMPPSGASSPTVPIVDLSALTSDTTLAVGQEGQIIDAALSGAGVPLRVAVSAGEVYDLDIISRVYGAYVADGNLELLPNNTTYLNGTFVSYAGGSNLVPEANYIMWNDRFLLAVGCSRYFNVKARVAVGAQTSTDMTQLMSIYAGMSAYHREGVARGYFAQTAVPHSSLGTVALSSGNTTTATIIVRRIL